MSEGPIAQWWKSHEPAKVSTSNAARVCYKKIHQPRAYCGRKPARAVDSWPDVTCADCRAASKADGTSHDSETGA